MQGEWGGILAVGVEEIGAARNNFIATQYTTTARGTAAKIREDSLLAIKQQEQEP